MREFVDHLRASHGFNIEVDEYVAGWYAKIPEAGIHFRGSYSQVFAWLQGYQGGYLIGRKYSGEEAQALIREADRVVRDAVVEEVARVQQEALNAT